MAASADRYVFNVEWFDTAASLYDLKNKKIFLKRCQYPAVTLDQLYTGAVITVFSRQLKIVEYGDVFTRKELETNKQKTYAMIKPDAYLHIGKIINRVELDGFTISNIKMTRMTVADASEFYGEHKGKSFYQGLIDFMTSDVIVGMELVADDAIKKWRTLIGPTNCEVARVQAPNSLRALYGTNGTQNACHGSDAPGSAQREVNFVFGEKSNLRTTAVFSNSACCVIKPHIIQERKAGQIIDIILSEGFEISALQMFYLDRPTAEEFLEVYKGVLPEFSGLVEHLIAGPCIALEIRQENVVQAFRELCGPHDPDLARALRPNSIRAKFGKDRIQNAVHCTDLPEDGVLESEYFFNVLQEK